jgi:hypothetical protein
VRGEEVAPYWTDHETEMKQAGVENLSAEEKQFWKDLIDKYLFVLKKDTAVSAVISPVHFPTLNMSIF